MKKSESTGTDECRRLARRLHSAGIRAGVYGALVFVLLAAAVIFGLSDNARAVSAEGAADYPVVYSAVSGSDAVLSPSDVEVRAEDYLGQFREFDRTYCYEYWEQCQRILAETPGYAPDAELTEQARADYERYVLVVRRQAEKHRAFSEKLAVCLVLAALGGAAAVLLGINRLFTAVRRERFDRLAAEAREADDLRE